MTPTESRRLARSQRDRAAYDERKARKQREAEERAMRAAEQKRREEEAARLRAEARRLAAEEAERERQARLAEQLRRDEAARAAGPVYATYRPGLALGAACLLPTVIGLDLATARAEAAREARHGGASVYEIERLSEYKGRVVREVEHVPPPRDALCADTAESGGCYHLPPGDPGREACRSACRMLQKEKAPRRQAVGGLALLLAFAVAGSA